MHRLFRTWPDRNAHEAPGVGARRPRRSRPGLESLEGRRLLSLGPELAGNAIAADSQALPVTAGAPDGRSVAAWLDRGSGGERIEFRLYSPSGVIARSIFVWGRRMELHDQAEGERTGAKIAA